MRISRPPIDSSFQLFAAGRCVTYRFSIYSGSQVTEAPEAENQEAQDHEAEDQET